MMSTVTIIKFIVLAIRRYRIEAIIGVTVKNKMYITKKYAK